MRTFLTCEQRSDEWRLARAGRFTASRAADAFATTKSGEAAAARDYRMQLAVERITGEPQDMDYVSKDMQRGIDLEPYAIQAYEGVTGRLVRRVGFVLLDGAMVGASPDGLVEDGAGVVEIKCPKSTTHTGYLREGTFPPEYVPQGKHLIRVTGAQWCDFVSFDDRMPVGLQIMIARMTMTPGEVSAYDLRVIKFMESVDNLVDQLIRLRRTS